VTHSKGFHPKGFAFVIVTVLLALLVMLIAAPRAKSGTVNIVTVSCDSTVLIIAGPNNQTTINCTVIWNLDPLMGYSQLAAVIFFPGPNALTGLTVIPSSAVYGISNYSGATPCSRTSPVYAGQIFTNYCATIFQTSGAPLISGSATKPITFQIPRTSASPGPYTGSISAEAVAWQ
jgi:hypothetical protein